MSNFYYIGVDVGTGSARATLVQADGKVLASSTQDTITYRNKEDHRIFEQSTTNIWNCIGTAIKETLATSKISPNDVKGVGFDATCSLAVSDQNGEPIIVTGGKDLGQTGDRNIILWADHRAEHEAELINSTGALPLQYVGGTMSLEMEIPKVLWLKNHMSADLFKRCQFFDLPDFLTYKATGDNTRSVCSVTCKCSYVPDKGWQSDFFKQIGLEELHQGGKWSNLGAASKEEVLNAGLPVGKGLSKQAAADLGLVEGTAVGSGLIDAYAGWMGTVAARFDSEGKLSSVPTVEDSSHRLAAVAGTSTCHIVQSPEGVFVKGVWGPYKDAVFPGWWMNEGGQSSTGQLIDFMLTSHKAYPELVERAKQEGKNIHQVLAEILDELLKVKNCKTWTELTAQMHFYPDLHGNRSPIADPKMRGSLVGLELSASLHNIALTYHLTLQAIALQTRHIVESLNKAGHKVTSLFMSGGQARNKTMMQSFADVCQLPVVLPADHALAVVLGSAMLGRFAHESIERKEQLDGHAQAQALWKIMVEMTPPGSAIQPSAPKAEIKLLEAKYKIFLESIDIQKRWRKEMEDATKP